MPINSDGRSTTTRRSLKSNAREPPNMCSADLIWALGKLGDCGLCLASARPFSRGATGARPMHGAQMRRMARCEWLVKMRRAQPSKSSPRYTPVLDGRSRKVDPFSRKLPAIYTITNARNFLTIHAKIQRCRDISLYYIASLSRSIR
jgi:hypothetical protein